MKNIVFISLLILGLWSCNDDDTDVIHVDLPDQAFSFTPVAGGAVMHYILPANPDITGIQVRYKDIFGNEIIRSAGSSCDSVKLVGFNAKVENVPAQVVFCFYDDRESQPFDVTFSTKDSSPVVFMKSVEVCSNWGGFSLQYNNPEEASGMAHVFYLGVDPVSQLPDTILINSFFLEKTDGVETLHFEAKQDVKDLTIVVRVEDFRGYIVEEKVWTGIENLEMGKLDPGMFTFFCDRSIESESDKLGVKYLFDGDKKGEIQFSDVSKKAYTFLAGPNSTGENAVPMYFDLKKNRVMASVRFYGMIKNTKTPTWRFTNYELIYSTIANEMPCAVTLYGLKDNGQTPATFDKIDAFTEWVKIGSFKQNKNTEATERWCKSCALLRGVSLEVLQSSPEEYMDVIVPVFGQEGGYRYLKIVVDEVFEILDPTWAPPYYNPYKYVSSHELEVYSEKD